MKRVNRMYGWTGLLCAGLVAMALAACTGSPTGTGEPTKTVANLPTIRIKAGIEEPLKDSKGVMWAADANYEGGATVDRPDLEITGTDRPELYRSEHYSMDYYAFKVPNGSYNVKLHFSEDFEGISDPSGRVFTYAVKDGDAQTGKTVREVKDFSPWKASGAHSKAYVDTVPVNVTKGQITITFTPQVENPQINAIEILPQ